MVSTAIPEGPTHGPSGQTDCKVNVLASSFASWLVFTRLTNTDPALSEMATAGFPGRTSVFTMRSDDVSIEATDLL